MVKIYTVSFIVKTLCIVVYYIVYFFTDVVYVGVKKKFRLLLKKSSPFRLHNSI